MNLPTANCQLPTAYCLLPTLREHAVMSKRGFTLVELAVVLVIVGLVVGGVMAGKDLIRGAQVRAQVSQVDKIKSAILTFKLKYDCIPGDCSTATNFFGATSQPEKVTNGNGNGIICTKDPYGSWVDTACNFSGTNRGMAFWLPSDASESVSVFDHLAAAGLFDFGQYDESVVTSMNVPGVGFPILKYQGTGTQASTSLGSVGGVIVTFMQPYLYSSGGHRIMLGACGGAGGQGMYFGCGYKPIEAFELDSKIDDGLPLTGKMILSGLYYVYRVPGDSNNEVNCNTTGTTNQYATSIDYAGFDARRCVPMIEGGF